MIMKGIALNSKLEGVENKNLGMKGKGASLKAKLANQRHYMTKVQKAYKQRFATSTVAAMAAEDRATQMAETVESLNEQLDAAQKDMKAVEETMKASSRVVRRRIDYDKPSRRTLATNVNNLTEYFTE
jgi:ribosomal protein L35